MTSGINKGKQVAALGAFARAQREENRRRLLAAARRVFERSGYLAPSVDDIAQEAGVSRQTFYRHFDGKLGVAMEYFETQREVSHALWGRLKAAQVRDPVAVEAWIGSILDHYCNARNTLRTFVEMGVVEPSFVNAVRTIVHDHMAQLGETIPAFRAEHDGTFEDRARVTDAILLVDQMLEQLNNFAMRFNLVEQADLVASLSRSFCRFIDRNS
jgi:AcrR family transcriptional regulator